MKEFTYLPQSPRWESFTIKMPEDMVQGYQSSKGIFCALMAAESGNQTFVSVSTGSTYVLREMHFSGVCSIVRGEGHIFLASSGSWSGGGNYNGAIALKPSAVLRYGAKGTWRYLLAADDGIREESQDPRGVNWQAL